ncbi:type II secretion system F family protein [Candidatus Uhrbacteria bacterium]|nr:type II secretion system F family protein [Candidatus Uhrbacteria bacterium]
MTAERARRKQKTAEKTPRPKRGPRFLYLSLNERMLLVRHLSIMLQAGIPLQEGLAALQEQTVSRTLKYVLTEAVNDLSEGQTLAHTLTKFPKLFDPFFSNVIGVGETSGTLSKSLSYLAVQLQKDKELRSKIRTTLIYPSIVFFGAIGIAVYLAFVLLPQFRPLFSSLGFELPPTTRLLLWVAGWPLLVWLLVFGGAVLLALLFTFLWHISVIRFQLSRAALLIPVFGALIRNIQTMRFARLLGTLLSSGVKVVPALGITAQSIPNIVYQHQTNLIAALVERGQTIGSYLLNHPRLFSRTTANMVAVGERTGKLSESLIALADFTDQEVDVTAKNLSILIEPLILIGAGILVGFIALAIITPIYQLTEHLSQ